MRSVRSFFRVTNGAQSRVGHMAYFGTVKQCKASNGGLSLEWSNGQKESIPSYWLKDQCKCQECFQCDTFQRLSSEPSSGSLLDSVRSADIKGDTVFVTYEKSDHVTEHPISFLEDVATTRTVEVQDDGVAATGPFNGQEVLGSKDVVLDVLSEVERNGFGLINNICTDTSSQTQEILRKIGRPLDTFFGTFWDFVVENNANDRNAGGDYSQFADTAYSALPIEPHSDGTYFYDSPGLQSLHCMQWEGEVLPTTIIMDAVKLAHKFKVEHPDEYDILCNEKIEWRYTDQQNGVTVACKSPVIRIEPKTGKVLQVRWNNHDRGEMWRKGDSWDELKPVYQAIIKWRNAIIDESKQDSSDIVHRIKLIPGTMIVFDNWRMLHSRSGFVGKRTLAGCYHPRQEFLSQLANLRGESPYRLHN